MPVGEIPWVWQCCQEQFAEVTERAKELNTVAGGVLWKALKSFDVDTDEFLISTEPLAERFRQDCGQLTFGEERVQLTTGMDALAEAAIQAVLGGNLESTANNPVPQVASAGWEYTSDMPALQPSQTGWQLHYGATPAWDDVYLIGSNVWDEWMQGYCTEMSLAN